MHDFARCPSAAKRGPIQSRPKLPAAPSAALNAPVGLYLPVVCQELDVGISAVGCSRVGIDEKSDFSIKKKWA
jgi:hypothetical protein